MKSITEIICLTESNIKELRKQFGYKGIGYYFEILEQMYSDENCFYQKSKLNKLSRDTKISKKNIEKLIKFCTQQYDTKGIPLLEENKKYFWNSNILHEFYAITKSAGRRRVLQEECINIKDAELVNLTQSQYDKLKSKYGNEFLSEAIKRLNNWLKRDSKKSKAHRNRNNYWHFRSDSWLIKETELALKKEL